MKIKGFYRLFFVVGIASLFVSGAYSSILYADSFSGGSYSIDASVMNSFGGKTVSTSYSMVSSGGESIIGNGSGGSYLLGQGYTSQLRKSLQISSQPGGLTAYYSLDELSGPTSFDWSVNNNNARNSLGNDMAWTASGKKNRAFDQAASTGYLETGSPPLSTVSEFTLEGWFYPYSTSSGMTLLAQDDATGTGDKWNINVNASGGLSFMSQKSGVAVSSAGTTALTNNVWQHILATYDGTTMKLYINGVLNSQQANAVGSHTFTLPMTIGARSVPATPNTFDGRIDEIRVYDRSISAGEVKNHYKTSPIVNPGFVYVGDVIPGVSSSVVSDIVVQTDAPGYNLNMMQFNDLSGEDYGYDIPAVSGSISLPTAWTEGVTKGFGFTLTSAPSLDSKWGTSPNYNYAAVPGSTTAFYTRSGGYTGGTKDVVRMQYRLDTLESQVADYYQNIIIITGTMLP